MTSCLPNPMLTVIPAGRGKISPGLLLGSAVGVSRWPTDPIGFATVTFSGVVAGSEIRVYDPDLNELAGIESCVADQVLSWSVYAPGSPYNTVQVKVVALGYKIKDFPYTSQVGNQSIPVQMEIDPWYRNPA